MVHWYFLGRFGSCFTLYRVEHLIQEEFGSFRHYDGRSSSYFSDFIILLHYSLCDSSIGVAHCQLAVSVAALLCSNPAEEPVSPWLYETWQGRASSNDRWSRRYNASVRLYGMPCIVIPPTLQLGKQVLFPLFSVALLEDSWMSCERQMWLWSFLTWLEWPLWFRHCNFNLQGLLCYCWRRVGRCESGWSEDKEVNFGIITAWLFTYSILILNHSAIQQAWVSLLLHCKLTIAWESPIAALFWRSVHTLFFQVSSKWVELPLGYGGVLPTPTKCTHKDEATTNYALIPARISLSAYNCRSCYSVCLQVWSTPPRSRCLSKGVHEDRQSRAAIRSSNSVSLTSCLPLLALKAWQSPTVTLCW